tara:strand:+ start:641 stop:961 length:321 start_codon:yes stop_codon:yes gene_type:complete
MSNNNQEESLKAARRAEIERLWFDNQDDVSDDDLLQAYKSLNIFKEGSYVKHIDQDIQGKVLYSDASITTIYDADCPNDDDFEEESYGPGSALTFKSHELKQIEPN